MRVTKSIQEVQALMDASDERELWIIGREFERPPYFHAGKGGDTRLARALRLCLDGRITPNSDGSYRVEGAQGRTYRVAEACSCPQSQHAQSKYCYHYVAVALYVEWQRRLRHPAPLPPPAPSDPEDDEELLGNGYPVDDQTLPLPLPPTTADERMAAPAAQELQGDAMTEDPDPYIPEPATPLLAPQTVTIERPGGRPTTVPLAPQDDDLERALQAWTQQRQVVQRFLKQELVPGVDFYSLRIGNRESKPSLSKAGAEKVLGWLRWAASFSPDMGTWEMLGRPTTLVCYLCTLRTRSGEIIGEGRGARALDKDKDVNKSIKMAQKSAQIDAVLRTGALSDVFTQDEDEMPEPAPAPAKSTTQELRSRIWALVNARTPGITDRGQVETWIMQHTGLVLHPDNYARIVRQLEAQP